jgi:hypothetical protein
MSPVTPYATLGDHNQMLAALRRRIDELGITLETLENCAGLQQNYATKILAAPVPQKRFSPFTMFLIAEALGLDVCFVENPQKTEKMRGRWVKRHNKKAAVAGRLRTLTFSPDQLRINGRRGGFARADRLGPDRRREIAQHANRCRWARKGVTASVS